MLRTMLKSKIHRAIVTEANLHYEGSITIDSELLDSANIIPNEKVHVVDIDNGARLETYAIAGEAGSGTVCLNGAAARLIQKGDTVIILSYVAVEDEEARKINPKIVYVDRNNRISKICDYLPIDDTC